MKPIKLVANPVSETQVDLIWVDANNIGRGYKIERSFGGQNKWNQITQLAAGNFIYSDTGLACATSYDYRIQPYSIFNDASYSNLANTTTFACESILVKVG